MVILTAANSDQSKNFKGKIHKGFSFLGVISNTIEAAKCYGYETKVFDLGTLGLGDKYTVEDQSFSENGFYSREVTKGYKSKSLFKPDIVKICMDQYDDLVVYLDGDAQLCDEIDEINTSDYDIGVTLRDASEMEGEWYESHVDIVKYVNAGVIFFQPTPLAKEFISKWDALTSEVGNDQMALNSLTCPDERPIAGNVYIVNGVRVKFFPGKVYNYYYFDDGFCKDVKIMHFKGPVRRYYPYTFKKKLYGKICVSLKKVARKLFR